MNKLLIPAILFSLCIPTTIAAEEAEPPPAPESGPCEAAEYRQFDFMSPWEGADYILPGDEKKEG
mgnify:FL=1